MIVWMTRNAGVAEDIKFTLSDSLMIRSLTSYRSASTQASIAAARSSP